MRRAKNNEKVNLKKLDKILNIEKEKKKENQKVYKHVEKEYDFVMIKEEEGKPDVININFSFKIIY